MPVETNLTNVSLRSTNVSDKQWLSLDEWNQLSGLEPPQRFDNGWGATFRSRIPSGVLSITSGSRVGYWNGLVVALGFVPRLTNGHVFLHALDLTKNLSPLLSLHGLTVKPPRVVVIDPGHGGKETGSTSVLNSGFEKDYTLDWALRVKPLLQSNGWKVLLTRASDVHVSLLERVHFAERAKADLFVSLHFNSVDSPSSRSEHFGVETYCLTPTGMPSNLTRNYKDNPAEVFPNNAFDAQNFQFAVRLHRAIIQFTGRTDRGIRRARFMVVLREQNRPAVLLEAGYMSDPEEARLIASAGYRQKLAEAVAMALE
ncbi:MAG: N-acetylmuramoyl-L-alanine amidase [Verrucomicrobia bacterium]|nr:N-acetylmuramoyl-L-alanine amidase [Verrucomicrobiota bacterium]